MTSPVPDWIAHELARWYTEGRTGTLCFNFRRGALRWWARDDRMVPPAPPAESQCPRCQQPLDPQDYGSSYRCRACGQVYLPKDFGLRSEGETP